MKRVLGIVCVLALFAQAAVARAAVVLAILLLGSGQHVIYAQGSCESRLVLWNKLGSDAEVLSSEVGPPGTNVGTSHAYETVQHGLGYVRKASGQNFLLYPDSLMHARSFRGAVEIWINPKVPNPVAFQYGVYGLVGIPWPNASNVALLWGDGVTGRGFYGQVAFDGIVAKTPDEPTQFVAQPGVPVHAAMCWDIDGIEGTADTIRVYRDGVVVGSTTAPWNPLGTQLSSGGFQLGAGPDSQGFDKYIVDNIKLWDFAKTDFSDRFDENAGCAGDSVFADIKPGSCPNSFNLKSHGKLPVAVVGTESFDVSQVEVASLEVRRADGAGGSVSPLSGPSGPSPAFEDVATPFDGEPCACDGSEGDGITDLLLKFSSSEVACTLELDGLPVGSLVELVVAGALVDGTAFEASDCIQLVPPPQPKLSIRLLIQGQVATFTFKDGAPGVATALAYSGAGPGAMWIPSLGITTDIASPVLLAGPVMSDATGGARFEVAVPANAAGLSLWFQVVQPGNKSNVVGDTIQSGLSVQGR